MPYSPVKLGAPPYACADCGKTWWPEVHADALSRERGWRRRRRAARIDPYAMCPRCGGGDVAPWQPPAVQSGTRAAS